MTLSSTNCCTIPDPSEFMAFLGAQTFKDYNSSTGSDLSERSAATTANPACPQNVNETGFMEIMPADLRANAMDQKEGNTLQLPAPAHRPEEYWS